MIYEYGNFNWIGAIGINEYTFFCFIEASNKEEALLWGHKVIEKYDDYKRLRPDKQKLTEEEILYFANIEEFTGKEERLLYRYFCKVGEYPDFTIELKKIEYPKLTPEQEKRLLEKKEARNKKRKDILERARRREE